MVLNLVGVGRSVFVDTASPAATMDGDSLPETARVPQPTSDDLERALDQLGSAKADLGVAAAHSDAEPDSKSAGIAEISSERILRRLRSPFSGRMGADYWSSIYSDRAEAASLIELLRNELETAHSEIDRLTHRLAELEAGYAEVAEALARAERRGYEFAVSQVYEALRRDPSANAASLILQISQQERQHPEPGGEETDVWRELDEELSTLRRKATRLDALP